MPGNHTPAEDKHLQRKILSIQLKDKAYANKDLSIANTALFYELRWGSFLTICAKLYCSSTLVPTEYLLKDKCTPRHGSSPAFTVPRIPNTLTISAPMRNTKQQKLTKTKLVILHVPCSFWNTQVPRHGFNDDERL